MSEWIDVNQKLPPDDELVLTYGNGDNPYFLMETARMLRSGHWTNSKVIVTHWMPLPDPPTQQTKKEQV